MLPRLAQIAARLGPPRARHLLVAGGVLIGLVLATAMTWYVATSRQTVIDDAVREMRNDALMLAEDEDRLLQAVDVMQLRLIDYMRGIGVASPEQLAQLMASQAVQQNLRDRIADLPHIATLMLFDRHGQLLNFSRSWPPPAINGSDRDFIREITAAGTPQTFVSEPSRGKVTGQWEIYLSRRFEGADGRLLGFVVSTIEIHYFEQYYAKLPLTGGGSFVLYRRDGMLIARYPRLDDQVGRTFAATANFRRVLGVLDHGVIRQNSALTGEDRLIVPHSMAHFPLIIAVSDTMASILRGWSSGIRILVATTALLELTIVGTLLLTLRHLGSHEKLREAETARARAEADLVLADEHDRAARALHMQEQRFDTALQNMVQGLLMVDRDGHLLVANRRFCELAGLPPHSVTPGMSYLELVQLVVSQGSILQDDMTALRQQRGDVIDRGSGSTFVWELSDGRAFTVTHRPMEEGWLTTYEDNTERRAAEARIAYLARHDALTDLPNRVLFHESLVHALAFARRGHLLALHCLDLDQFKAVNDTLGHPVGDGLLKAVAERLQGALRDTDEVARLGGDEFAIVQTAIESPLEATALASRVIELIEAPFEIEGHQIVIAASVGVAFAPQDGLDADELLKNADLALYRAKFDGRGVYRLFQTAMDAEMQARRVMELDLRNALCGGQFEVYYQPLVDLHARAVTGFEALLRWHHPERGMIPPDKFIPLAEEIGAILPIGEWVLRQACAAAAAWPGGQSISVNLSPVQFKSRNLVATVTTALRDAGLAPGRLELEITETVMLHDTVATLATLHELRSLGVRIAMDDFGTGYSSLSYLRRFPFDRIKIDQSFVRELGKQRDCAAIIRAVIALSHDLGMATTAEGVETREQLRALALAGCSAIQGYLFSRPLPLRDIPAMLRSMPLVTDLLRQTALVA
jgi:diguanylate cyclase (GGDEF)-like protein/PAS domain S-box-containing protein